MQTNKQKNHIPVLSAAPVRTYQKVQVYGGASNLGENRGFSSFWAAHILESINGSSGILPSLLHIFSPTSVCEKHLFSSFTTTAQIPPTQAAPMIMLKINLI